MTDGQPNTGGSVVTPTIAPAFQPEQGSVRRRRSRRARRGAHRSGRWVVRTRNRWMRTFALCAGVLLLMALGLYFGLAHQEAAPSEGAAPGSPFRGTGLA